MKHTAPLKDECIFTAEIEHDYGETRIIHQRRKLRAHVLVGRDCEPELALCLAALVQEGVIDSEKLRAALVLAEPVACEMSS